MARSKLPITEIESKLNKLVNSKIKPEEFIYNFLGLYDVSKSYLTKAKNEKIINLVIKNKIN